MTRRAQDKYCFPKLFWVGLCIFMVTACNTSKFLDDDQYLLEKNTVEFKSDEHIKDKLSLKFDLQTLVEQKPNSRYFVMKREWLFIKADRREDDFWLKEFMLKQGEKPTVYDSSQTQKTVQNLRNYMFNRGYFDAEIEYQVETKNKKAFTTYIVQPNPPYTIDELNYKSGDPGIATLLDSLEATSLLERGVNIDDNLYNKERARMTRAFLNNGYADFYANLISPLQVDTTNDATLVSLEVFLPPDTDDHIKKHVGDIYISTDYNPTNKNQSYRDTTYNGIGFKVPDLIGPSVTFETILDKVFLIEGQTTSQLALDNTYRGLSDLGVYKFISITPVQDSLDPAIIHYDIQLTRNKKWVFDTGLDFNYSTLQSQGFGRNLIGVTGSARLENRNLFKRAISLQLNGEIGAEVNVAQLDSFNTFSGNIEAILSIPRFTGFPGTLRFLSLMKIGNTPIINPKFFENVVNRGATQLRAKYQNVLVADFYTYQQFDINYGYDVPVNNRKSYKIGTIGINYYRPDTLGRFTDITGGAEYFLRSFIGDRLFTGFLYKDFSFYYQSPTRSDGDYWIVNFSNEVSGLEVWAVNSLYNAFTNKEGKFRLKLDKEIDFARFTTFEFQYRYYWQLRGNSELAFRFNPAFAISFDSLNVPFVKQFYIGGPQSLRGWQIREVGPGRNTISEVVGEQNRPFFSSGDIKIELNLEYRFDLFWLLESAVFLDAGNVWLIDSDEGVNNIGADFWRELAVGTGLGLRLDLTYALLRFDLGYKLKNPYKNADGNYWYHDSENPFSFGDLFQEINYNLAIGYPF